MSVELFKTGFPAELVSTLPCTDYGGTTGILPPEVRLMHVFVPGCKRGDILDIEMMCQVTTKQTYNVEFTSRLLLTPDETGFEGQRITAERWGLGQNITRDIHHCVRNMTGRVMVETDGDYWVAAIGYAGSSAAKPTDTVLLDRGGHISALRFRNSGKD